MSNQELAVIEMNKYDALSVKISNRYHARIKGNEFCKINIKFYRVHRMAWIRYTDKLKALGL